MALDGLVLSSVVYELQTALIGGRIDKVSQPDPHTIIISVRQPGEIRRILLNTDAQQARLQLTGNLPENLDTPPPFCMLLRKYLENGRIASIAQQNLDRIVHLTIENWDERDGLTAYILVVEVMGKHSNITLVNQHGIILDALHRIPGSINRHRELLPGRPYIAPPGQDKQNPLVEDENSIESILIKASPQQKLTNILVNSFMGIGPGSARELIARSSIAPDATFSNISRENTDALSRIFFDFMQELAAHRYKPTVVLPPEEKAVIDFACYDLTQYQDARHEHYQTMSAAMDIFFKAERVKFAPGKDELTKRIRTEKNRAERKLQALQTEVVDAQQAEHLKIAGDLLTANLNLLKKGQKEITIVNFYDPNQQEITLAVDPKLTPVENTQQYYHRYAKAKRSVEILEQQIIETDMEIDYLDAVLLHLEAAASKSELQEIRLELSEQGYLPPIAQPTRKHKKQPKKIAPVFKPMRFTSPDGWDILVGKNNTQNDYITFKVGRTYDLWLHTKNIPGSHVIVRMQQPDIPVATLETAAKLSAYFSKSRASSNVPVDYTLRKHVHKPSGAKPGFVIYEQQHTLYVTPDEDIARLANQPQK